MVRMAMEGHSHVGIIEATRVSAGSVVNVLRNAGGTLRRVERVSVAGRLSLMDRTEIYAGVAAGESGTAIARRLGSAASRQVARGARRAMVVTAGISRWRRIGGRCRAAQRPQVMKLEANPRLAGYVVAQLRLLWSPEQIVGAVG